MFFTNAINNLSSTTLSSLASGVGSKMTKSKSQQTVVFDVFKEHWRQVLAIFNKSLVNDDDIQIVKNNLCQMIALLINELNQVTNAALVGRAASSTAVAGSFSSSSTMVSDFVHEPLTSTTPATSDAAIVKFSGPLWDYLLATNIFETVYLWSLSYPEYLYDLKYEQLRNYEELISQMQTNEQTNLLLYR